MPALSKDGVEVSIMREIEKRVLLENVDRKWMDHLEAMDSLKEYIGLNAYAQRDPVAMFRLEGGDMFDSMSEEIKEDTVRTILGVMPRIASAERVQVARVTGVGANGASKPSTQPVKKTTKVGRNDPCPCGSGKKYKKCCGANGKDN